MRQMIRAFAASSVALVLAACGGGGEGGTGSSMGTMRVSLTDAPSCGYDAVNVSIEKVRVHASASAGDADGGWYDIVVSPTHRVDLMTLTNGVLDELGQVALPAGKYTQMRLVLADNGASQPFANSVVPSGAAETALDTPSAQQSGLKMNVDIDIPADKVADFVIDFDVCKSVVKRGNSGRYNLKPVLSVTPLLSDAGLRVVGYVEPAIALGSTNVSVQFNGVPVKSTVPEASGRFVLYPVPVGQYDLVVSATGRATAVVTGVPVVDTAHTTLNGLSVPIAPPLSAQRAVAGTVNPADATVRAVQTLSGGPRVEVAWAGVDADTGAFATALPMAAPVRVAFASIGPFALGFVADVPATGLYTIEAARAGVVKLQAIDVAATVQPLTFVFP
jgi:hypothetical protein